MITEILHIRKIAIKLYYWLKSIRAKYWHSLWATVRTISDRVGLPLSTTYTALSILKEEGLITIKVNGSTHIWQINWLPLPSHQKSMVNKRRETINRKAEKAEKINQQVDKLLGRNKSKSHNANNNADGTTGFQAVAHPNIVVNHGTTEELLYDPRERDKDGKVILSPEVIAQQQRIKAWFKEKIDKKKQR
jgi:hypothetical protein